MPAPAIPSASPTQAPPLDLPRQVMRRAALVALGVLLLAGVLGLVRMNDDIEGEVDAAMTLAGLMARLGGLAQADDRSALAELAALQRDHPLRHLELRVHGPGGRLLLGPPAVAADGPPLGWLLALHRELLSAPDRRHVSWIVPRASGEQWTISLAASHDSERREAMASLLDLLGLLLVCVAGLLLAMHWNVRRAFAPLGRLLDAIAGIEQHDAQAVQALPVMPIRELEAVAGALRHLGGALDAAEAQRRLLSQQVLTLQEDERARLARELHDEFGQRLTALRVDAAWLARRVADQPALRQVVDGMAGQCERVQQDIRALLARLQPFGPADQAVGEGAAAGVSLHRLVVLLQALVASWATPGRDAGPAIGLDLQWHDADGSLRPWPDQARAESLRLPLGLALTLYRISQEALTNVARHADARAATLSLHCQGVAAPGAALRIAWRARDDGVGLPTEAATLRRGNGLAGIRQRVWALGTDLRIGPATPDGRPPGLCLAADIDTCLLLPAPITEEIR